MKGSVAYFRTVRGALVGVGICAVFALGCCREEDRLIRALGGTLDREEERGFVRARFPSADDETLARLSGTSIFHLDLSGSDVSNNGLVFLRFVNDLNIIDLSRTRVGDAGIRHIVALDPEPGSSARTLQVILDGTDITDEGVVALSNMRSLVAMSLNNTRVTDHGIRALPNATALEVLSLSGTRLTDDGVHPLAGMSLGSLAIENTAVSDAVVADLRQMKLLQVLYAGHTNITPTGIRDLRRTNPHLTIYGFD